MLILGLDCGSSSIKAALLRNGRPTGAVGHAVYPTNYDAVRAEISPTAFLKAMASAINGLGKKALTVDCVSIDVMSPSWIAMDAGGKPLTPIVTHQDRRSLQIARDLESRIGKTRYRNITGNRPIPGGISSTTCAWFLKHEPERMKLADLVGHLSTLIHRQLTGARVTDPSNASFMGLYNTMTQAGWSDELCDAIGLNPTCLPDIFEANHIGGHVTPKAGKRFGLTPGTPVLVGLVDTSATMLLAGATPGKLLNVCGSTDVLAVCTDKPKPADGLLTRALGVKKLWMQVATLAAGGASLNWAQRVLFSDMSDDEFHRHTAKIAKHKRAESSVCFDPYLAGDRTQLEQPTAGFTGLTLSANRDQMLRAMLDGLATAGAARIPLLQATGTTLHHDVLLTGGMAKTLGRLLHGAWPGRWSFHYQDEATLRGLGKLLPE